MSSSLEKVQEIIADALYVEKEECQRDATLMGDLGAESIDFLDIIFRLEKEFGVKIPKGEIESKARGGLSDEEFAVGGVIQAKGLESLRKAMPEVDPSMIKEGLNVRDIASLFTVATFEKMVLDQLGQTAPAAANLQPALSNAGTRL
jgi:acyl carrier protein